MSARRSCMVGLCAFFGVPAAGRAVDHVPAPAPMETLQSPDGAYAFDIALAKRWRTELAIGTLRAVAGGQSRIVWQRSLPQRVRPRFALVANDGSVLLFDQFDNILGPIAVLLINPKGQDVAVLTFDDIRRVAGAPPADIAHQARHGVWLQRPPVLAGADAQVTVAGRSLLIDLQSGQLRLAPP